MYLPAHFAETRVEVLHEAIRHAGLATLVTTGGGGLDASHVPLLLDPEPGPLGRLVGHVARGNPQWSATPEASRALAILLGPDAYVTPSWYATKRETGKVVPTWNYLAIHAHGTVRFFQERERLLDVVTRLTDQHERGRPRPWRVTDAPADYLDGMLEGIVGVELTITRLEGKWKVSQNRSGADRRGVAEGLEREGRVAMAQLVRGRGK
ncbi:MAG TPA: FMN-binding negative transcriptional regulator [Anaeromyxobacteraceae bacterium]|nr:FMN-binding negative transcriptional regulator [Anaeromyxobacteraceae bacterium]